MITPVLRIVVTDSNVLINLMHVSRLGLLGSIPGHEFVVPDHVRPWARAMRYEMELARRRTPPVVARWPAGSAAARATARAGFPVYPYS